MFLKYRPRKPYWKGRPSTVDLRVLTSLDQLILILKILFSFIKTSFLNEEVNCTEPSLQLVFPVQTHGPFYSLRRRLRRKSFIALAPGCPRRGSSVPQGPGERSGGWPGTPFRPQSEWRWRTCPSASGRCSAIKTCQDVSKRVKTCQNLCLCRFRSREKARVFTDIFGVVKQ